MSSNNNILIPKVSKNNVIGDKVQWSEMCINQDQCTFIFTIRNYSLLNKKCDEFIESPIFTMESNKNICWKLKLFPEGKTQFGKHDNKMNNLIVSIIRYFKEPKIDFKAYFCLAIVDKDNNNFNAFERTKVFNKFGKAYSYHYPITKCLLLDNKEELYKKLLPNDTLTIFCSIAAGVNINSTFKTIHTSELENNLHVSKKIKFDTASSIITFEKMLENSTYFDATLNVEGKKIKVHKCVLATASPVFADILKKGKKVANKSITISDISYDIMNELVNFIYTKKINNLQEIAHELLSAANKYSIIELKNVCEKSIGENLNLENALKTFVVAEENNAQILKNLALSLIAENKKKFNSKPEFQEIIETRPDFLKEILLAEIQ